MIQLSGAEKLYTEIEAVQVGGEVHLRRVGETHPFVIVRRNESGKAVVGINDHDTKVREWKEVALLCWAR